MWTFDPYLTLPNLELTKGGGQGTASCRSLTDLLQSHNLLCSYVFKLVCGLSGYLNALEDSGLYFYNIVSL